MKEEDVRDKVMRILFDNFGERNTWEGEGKFTRFKLRSEFGASECKAEHAINYKLPNGSTLSHESDIFIGEESLGKCVSLEIKHESAVTDQFKARCYDIIHMRNTYGKSLLTIMLFVKVPSKGISIENAREICYAFDHLFGIPLTSLDNQKEWSKLTSIIGGFLRLRD
ncbi:MAG: hypothetical protein FJ004_11585 [Chloroflexi bacterium]|nr:hypothetical protein [Chloroflexota bacterium]